MYLIFKHKTFTNFFFFKLIYDILKCDIFYYREQLLESYKYDPLGEKYTRLQFTLLSHPMIRYRRYVVNDLLNVTFSVGSAIGLFMGASILSIFEIPYWLFIRRDKIK